MKLGTSQAAQVLTGVPVRGIMQGKNGTGEDGGHGRRARPSGRIDCGTLKRYSPINESPGAAATASLAKIEDRFTILAAITTTHDGPDAASEATKMLCQAHQLGADAHEVSFQDGGRGGKGSRRGCERSSRLARGGRAAGAVSNFSDRRRPRVGGRGRGAALPGQGYVEFTTQPEHCYHIRAQ